MVDPRKTGQIIAQKRKTAGLTQDQLAGKVGVSAQAVSKWEHGQTLPDTSILPSLGKALGVSIDTLLSPGSLQIGPAILGDGVVERDVTDALTAMAAPDALVVALVSDALSAWMHPERFLYLRVAYRLDEKPGWAYAAQDEPLTIDGLSPSVALPSSGSMLLQARYGNASHANDATQRIRHQMVFGHASYAVNHHTFDSPPQASGEERLTLLYANAQGLHVLAVPENHLLVPTADGFHSQGAPTAESRFLPAIPPLGFGQGMDCTWAGAMTHALNALGHTTDYTDVMGASGACFRIHFMHPTWDYSAVDALVVHDLDVPLFAAYGQQLLVGNPQKQHRQEEMDRILADLREGKPVVCINLRVAHEWGLITGYTRQPDGEIQLWCRTYYEFMEGVPPNWMDLPPERLYVPVENWPFILMHFGDPRSMLPRDEVLLNSLRVFHDCMTEEELHRGYAAGLNAYQVWRDALRDSNAFAELPQDVFIRRMGVNQFCLMALLDARRSAHAYLQRNTGILRDAHANAFAELVDLFRQIHARIEPIFQSAPDPDNHPEILQQMNPRDLWSEALRAEQADALNDCLRLEKQALDIVKRIIG